jgi:predicted N-acetyltransferase YhbS
VPATLLGQLAVDLKYQGMGCAKAMLLFAFRTSLRAAELVGSFGVLTHPLDAGLHFFYARLGFEDLPGDERGAMFLRMKDLRINILQKSETENPR